MITRFNLSHLPEIELIGVTDCSNWALLPRTIFDHELIVCYRGMIRFSIEGREYLLSPGDFLLIRPEVIHSASAESAEPVGFYYIHFTPAGEAAQIEEVQVAAEVRKAIGGIVGEQREDLFFILPSSRYDSVLIPEYISLGVLRDETLTLFEKALYERNRLTVSSKAMIRLYLGQILLNVSRLYLQGRHINPVLSEAGEIPRLLQQIIQYMYDHVYEPVLIVDICNDTGVSPQYVNRLFAKYLHISPAKYFNKLKIERAKDLMRGTNMRVKQIADAIGFQNAYYFSRLFRKTEGITPTAYITKLNTKSNQ